MTATRTLAGTMRFGRRRVPTTGVAVIGVAVLVVSMAVAVGIGSVHEPIRVVLDVVAQHLGLHPAGVTRIDDEIVWQLQMPRVLGGAAVGAGLAICGVVLQCLTRNDLADPYLLGISHGGAVGAATIIVFGLSIAGLGTTLTVTLAAFAGAFAALIAVLALATDRNGHLPPARTILAGVAVGEVCAAYVSFIVIASGQSDAALGVLQWTLGSLAGLRWSSALIVLAGAVLGGLVTMGWARHLDAFAFGETSARALGVSVERMRWFLLAVTALITAVLVAYAGAIGFVGLVVPHIARMLTGPRHLVLLPMSALVGAVLMVWADVGARALLPGEEIPIGIVTALLGAPFFAYLLRRRR